MVVVSEVGAPVRVPLDRELVVGRDPRAAVPLSDGFLSRRHCTVRVQGGSVVVRDLGSFNGTYVNGQRIHEECFVLPNDVLKVGRTRLFVDFGESQTGALKILAPKLEDEGVELVPKSKAPSLAPDFRAIAAAIPQGPRHQASVGAETRTIRPDDKTPIPPSVEESALLRSSTSGQPRPVSSSREHGLRVIGQIARIVPKASDPQEFLEHVLSRILEVIPAERGIVMRLDPERKRLYAESVKSALPGRDAASARAQGISHTIARKVIRERVSVLVDDAVLDQRFKDASSVQELQIRSILCAPLWLGESVMGLIYLDHPLQAYVFGEVDRELLVAAANLAALGLERGP